MEQKPHLVNWSIICLEKHKWGLGIKNLSIFNMALLGKWYWIFVSERNPVEIQYDLNGDL